MMIPNQYELTERLTDKELMQALRYWKDCYEGRKYRHVKSGNYYTVIDSTTININGKSYYGLIYRPLKDSGVPLLIRHTRPLKEFLDGRFVEVEL